MGKDLKGKELGKGIYQRKDGTYEAKVYFRGNPRPKSYYSKNLREVKRQRKEALFLFETGISIDESVKDLNTWFEHWMRLYNLHLKPTTIRNYVDNYTRGKTYIGHLPLTSIKPNNIQYMIESLKKEGYSAPTINSTLRVISMVLNSAVDNGYLLRSPCKNIVVSDNKSALEPVQDNDNEDFKCISKNKLIIFFNQCRNTRYFEFFVILLCTGLRSGELCALEWKDIDFKNKTINVYKTISRCKHYYDDSGNKISNPEEHIQITTPKTRTSRRKIPLNESAIQAFSSWKHKQDHDKLIQGKEWGKKEPLLHKYPDPVFTTKTGRFFRPDLATVECSRICKIINSHLIKESKISEVNFKVTPHMFRHTFITYSLESHMDVAAIQKIVGHATLRMTGHYTHIQNDFIQQEIKKYPEPSLFLEKKID